MCGIVGLVRKTRRAIGYPDIDMFKDMLITDAVRGADSTGAFMIDDSQNSQYVKIASNPFNLIRTKSFEEMMKKGWQEGQALVGHNRKATEGKVVNENAHPFHVGPIVLVHNGNISNYRSLVDIKTRNKHSIEVDSHAAALLIARNKPEEVIPEMRGAFTFVWFNAKEKTLNFIRNEERPLWFAESAESYYFASEGPMLRWLLGRRNVKLVENGTITMLKPGELISLNFDKGACSWSQKEVKIERPTTVVNSSGTEWQRTGHNRFRRVYPVETPRAVEQDPAVSELERLRRESEAEVQRSSSAVAANTSRIGRMKVSFDDIIKDIPEFKRFNICYGHDHWLPDDPDQLEPFQQIMWELEDYKVISQSDDRVWRIWGKALKSDSMEVSGVLYGTEDEISDIITAKYLISFVRRVRSYRIIKTGKGPNEAEITGQMISVGQTKPVDVVQPTLMNAVQLTDDHHKFLITKDNCKCRAEFGIPGATGDKDPVFLYAPQREDGTYSNEIIMQCSWCAEAEEKHEAAEAAAVYAG